MPEKHPMQPVALDAHGVIRFQRNHIVEYLLDKGGIDLNHLAARGNAFTQEDWEQFYQLIGYSIGGYHELSRVSDESCARASAAARELMPDAGGCRDGGCPFHGGPLEVKS